MRKKIIIVFLCVSAVILAGGFYIIFHVEKTSSQLQDLLVSHQVDILRRNLLEKLHRVQVDFYLLNTRYSRSIHTIVADVQQMKVTAAKCLGCHHSPSLTVRLQAIQNDIETYQGMFSRVLTMRADHSRLEAEAHQAYLQGQQLVDNIDRMIDETWAKLTQKTERSLRQMERTRYFLTLLLLIGPVLLALLSFTMISSITRPMKVMMEAIRTLKSGNMDFRIQTPLKDEFGELAAAFNEMTRTLREQMHKMQRTEQMAVCGQLAAGLAHEIKNPLAGIKAAIEVLNDENSLSTENHDILTKVVTEIRRLETLMRSLLDFARPPKPHFMKVGINDLLESTLSLLAKQPSPPGNGAQKTEIVKDFARDLPEVVADPQQLRQVLVNLLLNAREAIPQGGTITVKTSRDPADAIQIAISDTGKGLSPEIMDKVFQPFFTTKAKGTGLGLAISKQLIEQHGGVLSVQNNTGQGATFRLQLPLRQQGKTQHDG